MGATPICVQVHSKTSKLSLEIRKLKIPYFLGWPSNRVELLNPTSNTVTQLKRSYLSVEQRCGDSVAVLVPRLYDS